FAESNTMQHEVVGHLLENMFDKHVEQSFWRAILESHFEGVSRNLLTRLQMEQILYARASQ
ncbi:hypothetical protein PSY31_23685, partial [Shigella flexneri]|nr:hypothetical protein [Shigella flexneri]